MTQASKARIVGMGSYLPSRVLTNQDLERMVDTSNEWIVERTGILERRLAEEEETTADMACRAAALALEKAGLEAQEIDLIIVATVTSDYLMPSTASLVQHRLGAKRAAAVDLQAACTGHLYGLSFAKACVNSGMYRHVLLISADKMSSIVDYQDRATCILFGDGATAALISSKGSGLWLREISLGSDGGSAELLYIPAGGAKIPASQQTVEQRSHYIAMNGRELYKHAVRRMVEAAEVCMGKSGMDWNDVKWVVPHQANLRIIEATAKRLPVPQEKIFTETVHKYGNNSAASVGIALDELLQRDSLEAGESVMLVAFGSGVTWGAALATQISD